MNVARGGGDGKRRDRYDIHRATSGAENGDRCDTLATLARLSPERDFDFSGLWRMTGP